MQMRAGLYRIMRIALVAGLAWGGFMWLSPLGYAWVVWTLVGALVVYFLVRGLRQRRRTARAEAEASRFAESLMDPTKRGGVIDELTRELASLDAKTANYAHRALMLAEFLEADGAPQRAREVLDGVDDTRLTEVMSAVLRHARAVSSLSAGDIEAAKEALDALPGNSGDRLVDQRITIVRGMIAVEDGALDDAVKLAERLRDEAADPDIRVEARLLKAVAEDAAGKREAALRTLATLDEDMLEVLSVLGLPRVKRLLSADPDP